MSKAQVIAGCSIGSLALGIALFAYSPATCACLTPVQVLAAAAGLHSELYRADDLTTGKIEAGLNRTLRGSKPEARQMFPSPDLGCVQPSPVLTRCYVETGHTWFLSHGYRVDITQAADGEYLDSRVSRFWLRRASE
jgi:hypothetical protein